MKLIVCFVLMMMSEVTTQQLRQLYAASANSEKSAQQLVAIITKENSQLPVWKGYEGVSKMVMAKYTFSPLAKFRLFNEGKALLERAIQKDDQNVELRYLRLSVQLYAPAFLGYNKMIETDKKYLKTAIQTTNDDDLKQRINDLLKLKPV